jgi:hypothetical protein
MCTASLLDMKKTWPFNVFKSTYPLLQKENILSGKKLIDKLFLKLVNRSPPMVILTK